MSRSADGVWHRLRLAPDTLEDPSLAPSVDATDASPTAAIVVRDGVIAWIGPEANLPR